MVMTEKITQTRIKTAEFPKTGLFSLVGNTPLLPLPRIAGDLWTQVQVYAKAEWFNPGGSVKDRPAMFILQDALEKGLLGPREALAGFHLRQYGDRLCHPGRLDGDPGHPGDPGECLSGADQDPACPGR